MKGLQEAIQLRENGKLNEAHKMLMQLVEAYPHDPMVNYQCAWCCDVLGREKEAIPYYEKSIELGLHKEDLKEAYLGLGSTYRTVGAYSKSEKLLEKGIEIFDDNAMKTFLSMTKYNLGKHSEAMEILLKLLSRTSHDQDIQKFSKAIEFYADKLEKLW